MAWLPLFIEAERQRHERYEEEDRELEERLQRRLSQPYRAIVRDTPARLDEQEKTDLLFMLFLLGMVLGFAIPCALLTWLIISIAG